MINLKEFIQEGVVGMSEKEIDELVTELRKNSVELYSFVAENALEDLSLREFVIEAMED